MDVLSKDNAQPGMTPLEWCHAQIMDPIINQIIGEIKQKTIGKLKIKMGMPSELKAIIRMKKQLMHNKGFYIGNPRSIQEPSSSLYYHIHRYKGQ